MKIPLTVRATNGAPWETSDFGENDKVDVVRRKATRHFIDAARLALMKPGACLINVSRADVVERNALLEALRSGHLGGFALDPLYEEPGRQDDELLAFDNVILTPHMAGSPRSNGLRDIEELITGLAQALLE